MTEQPVPALLGAAQLARRLGVPPGWLVEEAIAGRIPCLRTRWRIVFDPDQVERLLRERARHPLDAKEERP